MAACDLFSSANAKELLQGKSIYFFGDSNTRALYKDLIWLLEDGRLIPESRLKIKNEQSHANDIRVSNSELHNGCNYEEVREYNQNVFVKFEFVTRLYLPAFITSIKSLCNEPDVVVLNSSVWDLTRWGSDGVAQFKNNLYNTLKLLRDELPSTRIIWGTTLPPAFYSQGGFLTKENEFLRNMLPWHVVYANKYASDMASFFKIDILDFHYQLHFQLNHHAKDGIHWKPKAVRYCTNMLLTHIALVWDRKLPNEYQLSSHFIANSQRFLNAEVKKSEGLRSNVWHDVNFDTDETNHFYNQVKVHTKSGVLKKKPLHSTPKNFPRPLWRNISNYNQNPAVKFEARNQNCMFRSVQNPGRVYKHSRQDQQIKMNPGYMQTALYNFGLFSRPYYFR